jgi:FtsP/CotA-like multicopper oxidase with cupredoxin domain
MDTLSLADGDTLVLTAAPVKKILRGRPARMFAYNGTLPGPLLKVRQGDRIVIRLRNRLGIPTTLHPHGIRAANGSDGTPEVQAAVADADSFDYALTFPDAGAYWYHPHLREAYGLEMGLYGGILVAPRDSAFWPSADREIPLLLDDVLVDSAGLAPHRVDHADYALMGRFGNVLLANGDTALVVPVRRNELLRFFLTNACNTRVLHLRFETRDANGAFEPIVMLAVGSDQGPFQKPLYSTAEIASPGERLALHVPILDTGTLYLNHVILAAGKPPAHHTLAVLRVLPDSVEGIHLPGFNRPDTNAHAIASIDSFRADFIGPPQKRLTFTLRMGHPHLAKTAHDPNDKGVEWEDHPMGGMVNSETHAGMLTWVIRDEETGRENHDIDWSFPRGSRVRIRIFNDTLSAHPMPHPIHFHGQRFLVHAVNGVPNTELAWKDTYLVGRGETADLLLDAWNPGLWMAHCHISEHLESMMMFGFRVE